jgi:hypothetical protein
MNEYIEKIVTSPKFVPTVVGIMGLGTGFFFGYKVGKGDITIPWGKKKGYSVEELHEIVADRRAKRAAWEAEHPEEAAAQREARKNEFNTRAEFEEEIAGMVTSDEETIVTIMPVPGEENDPPPFAPSNAPFRPKRDTDPVSPLHPSFAHGSSDTDTWDYDVEVQNRTEDKPYVLHRDEFFAEENREKGYIQTSLTWYSGDNVMVDEEDVPVYNHETIVGPLLFGHGSDDVNVFYVRNDLRHAEYEVLFDPGAYATEVLGLNPDGPDTIGEEKRLKHSADHVRRFRSED